MELWKLISVVVVICLVAGYLSSFACQPQVHERSAQVQSLQAQVQETNYELQFFRCQGEALSKGWAVNPLSSGVYAILSLLSSGSEQDQQNIASQASVAIESANFTNGATGTSITITVKNVGAVPLNVTCNAATGTSTNRGFKGWVVAIKVESSLTVESSESGLTWSATGLGSELERGATSTVILYAFGVPQKSQISSGDKINIFVSTGYGTFTQAPFTVG